MGYGGYGYLQQKMHPSSALSTKKEYTKESSLEKLFHNVWAYYIHKPTPLSNGVCPPTFVELMNWKWKCVPQKCVPQTAMYDYVSLD